MLKIFAICFTFECANHNFSKAEDLIPLTFEQCRFPYWDCINDNITKTNQYMNLTTWRVCGNLACVNDFFADLERNIKQGRR
jgi:hypothetical protein